MFNRENTCWCPGVGMSAIEQLETKRIVLTKIEITLHVLMEAKNDFSKKYYPYHTKWYVKGEETCYNGRLVLKTYC